MSEVLLDRSEAAERLRVSARTVRRYEASGLLDARRVGPKLVKVTEASVEALKTTAQGGNMEDITVEVGEPARKVQFRGQWLVEPHEKDTRSSAEGADAGVYWGVARTGRDRIAVFTAHCNEMWPAFLNDYDDLDDAEANGVPADIIDQARAEGGESKTRRLDI